VLVAGRAGEEIARIAAMLNDFGDVRVTTRHIVNGHSDPLQDDAVPPDALVLVLGERTWEAELAALVERAPSLRPPLLAVGPCAEPEVIRMAMRAGARDYVNGPIGADDLFGFLQQIGRERQASTPAARARLTAVVNAKGGSGASMVAANLAHALAQSASRKVLLMDLDLQFGGLPLYLNLSPRNGLVRALENIDGLDAVALEGYVQIHDSGLHLLASAPSELLSLADLPESRVAALLHILAESYDDIVVDLPRWIGGATAEVLERADRILLLTQQSIAHLRDAARMASLLQNELGIPAGRIRVVVNRHEKRHSVQLEDIREALPGLEISTLPNDFRRVSQSVNVGTPLFRLAARAPISRDLVRLSQRLGPDAQPAARRGGLLGLLGWART
jgi:pilus assembly protein CpaE